MFRVEVRDAETGDWFSIGWRPSLSSAQGAAEAHFDKRHKRAALTFRITEYVPVSDPPDEFTLRRPI